MSDETQFAIQDRVQKTTHNGRMQYGTVIGLTAQTSPWVRVRWDHGAVDIEDIQSLELEGES